MPSNEELYPNLEEMEREPSDKELFDQNPLPPPIENGEENDGPDVQLVTDAEAPEKPKLYGPFLVTEIRDEKENILERPQKSIIATLEGVGGKRTRFLVSAFDNKIALLEDVRIGASYNFRGIARRKISWLNGEKRVSYYLNIV
jgi:hypothetical protein